MRVRQRPGSVVLLVFTLTYGFAQAAFAFGDPAAAPHSSEDAAQQKDAKKLLTQGDQLADETKYAEALLRYKEAYQQIVPQLRGLDFKEAVDPSLMTRGELQKRLAGLVAEEIPPEKMVLMERSLKVFGFIPAAMKVESTLLNLYTEEVAGFYHPKTKKIFLITEVEKPKKRGLVGLLFGRDEAFNKEEQKIALAHEMAHALADQHYNLDRLQEAAADDEDMQLALSALIEGEATMVMMAEMMRESGNAQDVLHISPDYMNFSFSLMRGFLPFATGKTYRSAPLIFRESLIFPYLQGMVFVLHLTNRGGWDPVNRAFVDPPASTEQVLHPKKFIFPRDEPTAITLPRLKEVLGEAWKELGSNVLGEFQIGILLTRHNGTAAAAGWDGDRYAVFEHADGKLALAWFSTWDNPQDAKEFAAAYSRYLQAKLNPALGKNDDARAEEQPASDPVFRLSREERVSHVERRDRDVVVMEGFSADQSDRLLELLVQSEKKTKRFVLPEPEAAQQP